MKIPDIREEMHARATERVALADALVALADELREDAVREHYLAEETKRRPSRRRPDVSDPVTEETRLRVFEAWYADPTIAQHILAAQLNLNPARISEILRGFRT